MTETNIVPSIPFVAGPPELLMRVGPVSGNGEFTTGFMQTGPWSTSADGETYAGSLGVLIDDVFGYPVVAARPRGYWGVSTGIYVDFCGRLPEPGTELHADSHVVHASANGGLGRGHIYDANDRLVAIGTERVLFVPGDPRGLDGIPMLPVTDDHYESAQAGPMGILGAEATERTDGASLRFEIGPQLTNPLGNLHGGMVICASEVAGQLAARAGGIPFLTSSIHASYIRGIAPNQTVTADAILRHRGRTTAVAEVTIRDSSGALCTLVTLNYQVE